MKFRDGRFSHHPTFPYFATNSLMRWQALQNGLICMRNSPYFRNVTTIDQLTTVIETHPNSIKSILAYNQNLRTTSSYWQKNMRELIDMVQYVGSPTFFITLSAADIHWKELNRLFNLPENHSNLSEVEQNRIRNKLLNKNPMLVAFYFHCRSELFFHSILIPKFSIKDYWYRYEFQKTIHRLI